MPGTTKKVGALEISTPNDRDIVMTRTFDAPRTMVWDAFTKPEYVRRWLGAMKGWTMTTCDIDLRVGGKYRYAWRNDNGSVMGMGGEYREVLAPERIVNTEKFDEAWYPGEAVGTVVFIEKNGRTTLTETVRYATKEARDGVIASPMAEGVAASFDRLEELLVSLPAASGR